MQLPKLVEDAKQAWKWYSVHWFIAIAIAEGLWAKFGPQVAAHVNPTYLHLALVGAAIVGATTRLLAQSGVISKDGK